MIEDYSKEAHKYWLTTHGVEFKRKLENETAYDGIVKIYSITTDNDKLNRTLNGLYFGNLGYPTSNGILLRKFRNKDSWPRTILTYLTISTSELRTIRESKSSFDMWTVNKVEIGKYEINLSPTETIEFIER
ncbi:MAG: hypothetical protein QM762_18115 [Chryseolinea sp.]